MHTCLAIQLAIKNSWIWVNYNISLSRYNLPRWMLYCDGFGQVEITTCCRPARDRTRALCTAALLRGCHADTFFLLDHLS
jgi:hypothetical protein